MNQFACRSSAHVSRRSFLQGATGGALGMMGFDAMTQAAARKELQSKQKQVVVFWMTGGVSPVGNVGSQAEYRYRRAVSGDSDFGSRCSHFRTAAAHREGDASPRARSRDQHEGKQPRQGQVHHADRVSRDARFRLPVARPGDGVAVSEEGQSASAERYGDVEDRLQRRWPAGERSVVPRHEVCRRSVARRTTAEEPHSAFRRHRCRRRFAAARCAAN